MHPLSGKFGFTKTLMINETRFQKSKIDLKQTLTLFNKYYLAWSCHNYLRYSHYRTTIQKFTQNVHVGWPVQPLVPPGINITQRNANTAARQLILCWAIAQPGCRQYLYWPLILILGEQIPKLYPPRLAPVHPVKFTKTASWGIIFITGILAAGLLWTQWQTEGDLPTHGQGFHFRLFQKKGGGAIGRAVVVHSLSC